MFEGDLPSHLSSANRADGAFITIEVVRLRIVYRVYWVYNTFWLGLLVQLCLGSSAGVRPMEYSYYCPTFRITCEQSLRHINESPIVCYNL